MTTRSIFLDRFFDDMPRTVDRETSITDWRTLARLTRFHARDTSSLVSMKKWINDEGKTGAGKGALTTFDRLHSALRGMGFRDVEARKAVATVRRMHDANEAVELEQVLREAVLVATAA